MKVEALTELMMCTLANLTNTEVSSVDTLEQHNSLSEERKVEGIRMIHEKLGKMNILKLTRTAFILFSFS
jgi:hypothetical protein